MCGSCRGFSGHDCNSMVSGQHVKRGTRTVHLTAESRRRQFSQKVGGSFVRLHSSQGIPGLVAEATESLKQDGSCLWAAIFNLKRPVYESGSGREFSHPTLRPCRKT
jgi:hypothetical protein